MLREGNKEVVVPSILMPSMYILCVSIEKNNNNQKILEINALSLFESSSYFGGGPWIPQTPEPQQDTGPKERWQEDDDDDDRGEE